MAFNSKAKLCLVVATALFSFDQAIADDRALEEFYLNFKQGNYQKAVSVLEKMESKNASDARSYLLGLSYARLQEYDKAILYFEKAIAEKNSSKDLFYEYGQALYAANELKKSRDAFNKSAALNFNRPASLYYVAHISQILEEHESARDNYLKVLKDKDTEAKMKQIAQFQLAESLLSIAREKSENPEDLSRRVDKFVVPMMRTAQKMDLSTPVAYDISQRIAELMTEFGLDPDQMANGRRLSPKRFSGFVAQKIKFDDNITQTNEENNVQQTKKESYVFETEVFARNDFSFKKRFIVSPEFRLSYVENGDQSSPEVYTNDSISINASLKNKYETLAFSKPSSVLFDLDLSRTYKDWQQRKSRDFYANSLTFSLGQSFGYFNFGDTSVRLKRKAYKGDNEAISNNTTSLTIDQTAFLPVQHLVIFMFDASFIDNFNNKSTNTNTFLTRVDYLIPEIVPTWTVDFALAMTVTDTKEQESVRGTEFTLNPSVDLSKDVNQRLKVGFNYDYTKNNSRSTSYDYSKSVFTTEMRYSF